MSSRPSEFRSLVKLAVPVVLAQVGVLALQLVDSLMVGRAGADQLAGLGAGMAVVHLIIVSGIGFLFALDATVSQAHGAGDRERVRRYFYQGLWAAGILTLVLTPVQLAGRAIFAATSASDPAVVAAALPYLDAIIWSYGPLLLGVAIQRYLQAIGIVAPIVWITLAGNVLNYFANLWLILGKPEWGIPALGAEGAAWATLAARVLMLAASLAYVYLKDPELRRVSARWDPALQRELFRVGWPAGAHFTVEVGAFAIAALLASTLGAMPMAAHHVVITIASFTFMVPMGISSATAVRVGHHVGAGRPAEAAQVGWFGVALAVGVMAVSGVLLLAFPGIFLGAFTEDAAVLALGGKVLFLAALFQVFDGMQVGLAGALRGASDTRSPALANFVGHYPVGLLGGTVLCFGLGMGLQGIWMGLTAGLFSVSLILLFVWRYRAAKLRTAGP